MKAMKKLQIAVAVASLFAVGAVSAATISQSGVTIAREVIASDAQTVIAPTATFTYAGSLSANAASSQDFNIVLTLGQGAKWKVGADLPTVGVIEFKVFDGGSYVAIPVLNAGATAAGKAAVELIAVEAVDATNTALRYKFRLVNKDVAPANLSQVQVNFNVTKGAVLAATVSGVAFDAAPATGGGDKYALVTNLFTVNGIVDADGASEIATDVCSDPFKRVSLNAVNFTGSGVGVVGESGAGGVTNNGYILLDQALNVRIAKQSWTPNRTTNPAVENKSFSTDPTNIGSTGSMSLGSVNFRNLNTAAWDIDVDGQFYSFRANTPAGYGDLATPAVLSTDGAVDTASLVLKLFSSAGFASGSSVTLANNPMCLAGGANVVSSAGTAVASNGGKDWTVTFSHAQLVSVAGSNAGVNDSLLFTNAGTNLGAGTAYTTSTTDQYYICYNVPGNTEIPQSTFEGIAQLIKETNAGTLVEQTNQSCRRPLAGLGGGVKIDVRNFLPYDPNNAFYMGIVRVINNSETTDADLIGQYIRADGKYGKWGNLGTLPARGARYFTSQEIDTLLNTNSTHVGADNTGAGGLTAAAGEALPANTRLRISSTKASTLRVQNYIYHTVSGALTEVSSSQGADFVNVEASDRDHIDQDAQTGIKK